MFMCALNLALINHQLGIDRNTCLDREFFWRNGLHKVAKNFAKFFW